MPIAAGRNNPKAGIDAFKFFAKVNKNVLLRNNQYSIEQI